MIKTYLQRRKRMMAGLPLALVTVVALVAYLLWSSYQQTLREAQTTSQDFAALIEARLEATFRNAEAELREISALIPPQALHLEAVPQHEKELLTELKAKVADYPEVSSIRIFNAEGDLLYAAGAGEVRRVNIADSAHFQELRAKNDDWIVFSDVIIGRTSGQQVLVVARALRGSDGQFAGMAGFSIRVDYFLSLFKEVELGIGGNVALYRKDNFKLVMRWPVIEANINKPLPADSPTRAVLADGRSKASLKIVAASDGRERLYNYSALKGYPFFVSVGVATDTVLADWRNRSLGVATLTAVLFLTLGVLYVQWMRAEGSIAQFNADLETRVRERTAELEAFSYSISHDLRTPLRAIAGIARILETDYAGSIDPAGRDLLVNMRESSQRMGSLIEGLLQLSRLSRAELSVEVVDLCPIAGKILERLRRLEPQRKVVVLLPEKLEVRGDPKMLTLVLENLLGNAWKFTGGKDEARIEVGAEPGEGGPVIFVRDDGAGFDPLHADKMFMPFHRLHRDDEFPGTGIGLATVQRIIQRHGGAIRAEGAPGKGATFYFTLPV